MTTHPTMNGQIVPVIAIRMIKNRDFPDLVSHLTLLNGLRSCLTRADQRLMGPVFRRPKVSPVAQSVHDASRWTDIVGLKTRFTFLVPVSHVRQIRFTDEKSLRQELAHIERELAALALRLEGTVPKLAEKRAHKKVRLPAFTFTPKLHALLWDHEKYPAWVFEAYTNLAVEQKIKVVRLPRLIDAIGSTDFPEPLKKAG